MSPKKILCLLVAVALSCMPLVTSALSLGDLHAFSRQGEPLEAEVKLVSFNPKTRLEQIKVSIPSLAMFKRFNLRKHAFLDRIRFTSVQTQDGFVVKLVSSDVMPTKSVDLLMEVEINGERTLKQYRLALPAQRASQTAQQTRALPVAAPANVLSKKVPQHVTFAKQQPNQRTAQQTAQRTAKPARALPVAKPRPQKPVANQSLATNRPVRRAGSASAQQRKQQPKQTHQPARQVAKQTTGKRVRPAVNKPVQTAKTARQSKQGADTRLANTTIAAPATDTYEPFAYEDWQAGQGYYRDYTPPQTAGEANALAGQQVYMADQAEYTDNYIRFVPPPPLRATHHTVQRGDTLSKIAARYKPVDVTNDQMLFALFKHNSVQLPTIEKIDKLYVGQRLQLPAPEEVRAFSRAQGRKFKQSYLEKHRQRLAAKRKAAEQARLAKAEKVNAKKVNAKQLAANQSVRPPGQQTAAKNMAGTKALPMARPVKSSVNAVKSAGEQLAASVLQKMNNNSAINSAISSDNKPDNKVVQLEGRLRKVKRLLEIEKQKHATTKKVVKEKNRLIQRKDNMIQDLQVAGIKGNKAEQDNVLSPVSAAATAVKQSVVAANTMSGQKKNKQALAMAAPDTAVSPATGGGGASASDKPKSNAMLNDAEALPADETTGLTALWAATWSALKNFFVQYPVLSVLLPVIALLGLLMLLFKPGRKRKTQTHSHTADYAGYDPLHAAAVEPVAGYSQPAQQQHNTPAGRTPHTPANMAAHSALHDNASHDEAPVIDSQPDSALGQARQMGQMALTSAAAGNDAVSMSGHGPQTVVINISAPAKLSIDMTAEGQQLDILRQQTDKLKESLRSLENSSRMLSQLNAADREAGAL